MDALIDEKPIVSVAHDSSGMMAMTSKAGTRKGFNDHDYHHHKTKLGTPNFGRPTVFTDPRRAMIGVRFKLGVE